MLLPPHHLQIKISWLCRLRSLNQVTVLWCVLFIYKTHTCLKWWPVVSYGHTVYHAFDCSFLNTHIYISSEIFSCSEGINSCFSYVDSVVSNNNHPADFRFVWVISRTIFSIQPSSFKKPVAIWIILGTRIPLPNSSEICWWFKNITGRERKHRQIHRWSNCLSLFSIWK